MQSLQDLLDEMTANTRELVPAERLAVGEQAIAELFATGIEDRILPVGALAPSFALVDQSGKTLRSEELLSTGPLVIKFFRGRWCSYCTTELGAWRDLADKLAETGSKLVGISPQTTRQNDFMAEQCHLSFPLLRDEGCQLASQFGLSYELTDEMRDYYQSILINLPFVNGEPSWRLPLAATYLIGRDNRVLFAEAHADFRVRPEPGEVLTALIRHLLEEQ